MKRNYLMIFMVEFVAMAIEVCMSYILSPYFGDSNIVWTGVVSVILLSNSIGNWIGGSLKRNKVGTIAMLASVFLSASFCVTPIVCFYMCRLIQNNTVSSVLTSVILLLPCEICIGTIPSQIMKNETDTQHDGKRIGLIYALSTVGGVVGSIVNGFILVPYFGTNVTMTICIIMLLMIGVIVTLIDCFKTKNLENQKEHKFTTSFLYTMLTIVFLVIYFYGGIEEITSLGVIPDDCFYLSVDSEYNKIQIYDSTWNDESVRIMNIGSGLQSASYNDENKRFDTVFDYCTHGMEIVKKINKEQANVLMIGGGAYQMPKYLLANTNYNINVVEIDPKVTELTMDYFYLRECINIHDTEKNRFKNTNMDAKVFLNKNDEKYDYIINDAFSGIEPVRTLTTIETARQIKNALIPTGVYMANLIASKSGERSGFLKAEANTIAQVFKYVYVVRVAPYGHEDDETVVNNWLIASDIELPFVNEIDFADGIVLTDDHCPIDILLK